MAISKGEIDNPKFNECKTRMGKLDSNKFSSECKNLANNIARLNNLTAFYLKDNSLEIGGLTSGNRENKISSFAKKLEFHWKELNGNNNSNIESNLAQLEKIAAEVYSLLTDFVAFSVDKEKLPSDEQLQREFIRTVVDNVEIQFDDFVGNDDENTVKQRSESGANTLRTLYSTLIDENWDQEINSIDDEPSKEYFSNFIDDIKLSIADTYMTLVKNYSSKDSNLIENTLASLNDSLIKIQKEIDTLTEELNDYTSQIV